MITAVSRVKQNVAGNISLKHVNQVAFTGSPISLLRNEGKISRVAGETTDSICRVLKNLFEKAELPFSKKPLTANSTLKHIVGDGQVIIDVPIPEVHTAVTKVLDANNILVPDATDMAINALDAASTKAALAGVLSGTSHAFDAVTNGANVMDALVAKADIVDVVTTTVEHKSFIADIIEGIAHII